MVVRIPASVALRVAAVLPVLLLACGPAVAEVIEAEPGGFYVASVAEISASREVVWRAMVDEVGSWWDAEHTFGGDASRLTIEAAPGGCFCETLDGGGVRHMQVVYAQPGTLLRMTGGLGPLQGEAATGTMSWQLDEIPEGTRLTLTYKVAGFMPDGLDQWAPAVDAVLALQLRRLEEYVEERNP